MASVKFALGQTVKIVRYGNPDFNGLDGVVKGAHRDKDTQEDFYLLHTPLGLIELTAFHLIAKGPG